MMCQCEIPTVGWAGYLYFIWIALSYVCLLAVQTLRVHCWDRS